MNPDLIDVVAEEHIKGLLRDAKRHRVIGSSQAFVRREKSSQGWVRRRELVCVFPPENSHLVCA